MNTQPQPNSKQLQRWEEKNIWLLESLTYWFSIQNAWFSNKHYKACKETIQYSPWGSGRGGKGGAVTLAETATDEKQTSIVLKTKG